MSDGGRSSVMSGGHAYGGGGGGFVGSSSQHRRNTRILSSRFNQEHNCIAVATTQGFRVLNCDPFSKCYEFNEGGVSLVEMLYCTSLIALVGAGEQPAFSPRRLRIFNTKTEKYICELNFLSTVLNVKLSYAHLIAVLEHKIHIFDLRNMKIIHTLDTTSNVRGLCALTASDSHAYMCYPASEERGELFVYDAINLRTVACIRAHNTALRCVAFNQQGTMLATCSTQGTVIRVWSVPLGKKLFTFRRGTYPARINTIAFNRKSDMIVVSSDDSSTVHVFSMRDQTPENSYASTTSLASPSDSQQQPASFLGSSAAGHMLQTVANSSAVSLARGGAAAAAAAGVSGALSFLPNLLQDMVEPSRNFAYINLKDNAIPSVVAFAPDSSILVVTTTGYFSVYSPPSPSSGGGACKLESEHSLLDQPSEAIGTKLMEEGGGRAGGGGDPAGQQRAGFYGAGLNVQEVGNGFCANGGDFDQDALQRKR